MFVRRKYFITMSEWLVYDGLIRRRNNGNRITIVNNTFSVIRIFYLVIIKIKSKKISQRSFMPYALFCICLDRLVHIYSRSLVYTKLFFIIIRL